MLKYEPTLTSREELEDGPRRRRKGTSDAPKKSLYDTSYFDVSLLPFITLRYLLLYHSMIPPTMT